MTLANVHGIDLKHVAGASSNVKGIAARRKRREDEIAAGVDVRITARGHGNGAARRPQWTLAELGQAAQDVPRLPWLALRFSVAGDQSGYWELWYALVFEAQRAGRAEGWAPRIKSNDGTPRFYQHELAQLVLDADVHRALFLAAPQLFFLYMGVTPEAWGKVLAPRYVHLHTKFERWVDTGRSLIQRWLCEDAA